MNTEIVVSEPTRLVKVLGVRGPNNVIKAERVLTSYAEAKEYAQQLQNMGFIVMFEPLVFSTYKELANSYMEKIKDMELEGGFYV